MKVKDIGEDALVSLLTKEESESLSAGVVEGPGDDCAVVEIEPDGGDWLELLKTDCLVESVHFAPGTDPEKVGWKAICRVISDIAAMGGKPKYALITIATSPDREVAELEGWYAGMRKAAREFGNIAIVGGETTSLPSSGGMISIAMTGVVKRDRYATRSGAAPGDCIAVTGRLGGSFSSGRHLSFRPRLEEAAWLMNLENQMRPTAMMDLSDGLAKDLPRLADCSGVLGYEIEIQSIPIHEDSDLEGAVGDGEDYELLFTLPETAQESLSNRWGTVFPDLRLSIIGKLSKDQARTPLEGGWDHFSVD